MRLAIILLSSVLLSACIGPQVKDTRPADAQWQARLQQQQELKNWAFRGRTAIRQDREGWNASLNWEQKADDFLIQLSGPFSQGGARLEGNAQQVTLTLDNGERYQADSPERLLMQVMGWQLPVSALRDWVRGLPYAQLAVDKQTLDERGRLRQLEQGGWHVDYRDYMAFEQTTMPAKIFITHPDLDVRIMISRWQRPE